MKAYAVVGLQYGSEGKGNVVAKMALEHKPDVLVHNWGPNSGHTAIVDGRKVVHTMLHLGIFSPNVRYILFGPGCVINMESLVAEINEVRDILDKTQPMFIFHPQACVVSEQHREAEQARINIGSTMKGTAEAMIDRMRRPTDGSANIMLSQQMLHSGIGYSTCISAEAYANAIDRADLVAIEGCQGYSLSMYNGFYPYTTSRDTSVNQLLADCAIPRSTEVEVIGCVRTFPIRVANRYNEAGDQIGFSGPCHGDQEETTWEAVGQEVEHTTVTKLPRRVFTFSMEQVAQACRMNGVDQIALTFADYLSPEDVMDLLAEIFEVTGVRVKLVVTGPNHDDVAHVTSALLGEGPGYNVLQEDDGEHF